MCTFLCVGVGVCVLCVCVCVLVRVCVLQVYVSCCLTNKTLKTCVSGGRGSHEVTRVDVCMDHNGLHKIVVPIINALCYICAHVYIIIILISGKDINLPEKTLKYGHTN